MAEANEHGTIPAVKSCTICGKQYTRRKGYGFRQWATSTTCSRNCSVAIVNANRVWPTQKERFEAKVDRSLGQGPEGTCHEWKGHRIKWGYGSFKVGTAVKKAHRVAYELYCGEVPSDQMVLHSCDNPPCCNPNHLSLGDQAKNMQEKRLRGRNRNRGENKLPRVDDDPDGMPIPGDLRHLSVS